MAAFCSKYCNFDILILQRAELEGTWVVAHEAFIGNIYNTIINFSGLYFLFCFVFKILVIPIGNTRKVFKRCVWFNETVMHLLLSVLYLPWPGNWVRPKLVLDHPLWSSKAPQDSFQPFSFVVSPIHTVLCCKICNIKPCSSVVDYDPCPQISPRDARHSFHHVQEKSPVYHSVLRVWIYANFKARTLPAHAGFSCGTPHDQGLSTHNPVIRN